MAIPTQQYKIFRFNRPSIIFGSATYDFRAFRRIYKSEEIRKVLKVHTLIMRDLVGKQEKKLLFHYFSET